MSLKGQKILIIGGSAGIGKETARAARDAGADVVIASRTQEHVDAACEELGEGVQSFVLDVRDSRVTQHVMEQIGAFDHLVVTAAQVQAQPFVEQDLDEARKIFDSKFWGQLTAVQMALSYLKESGSITLFSGVAARRPVPGLSIVAAVNGAVEALVRALALELCPLRVNAVSPGFIDTHNIDEEKRRAIEASLPVRRIGQAEDVAKAVLLLMDNSYITGTVLQIDGGRSIA
jgi:NAD(P)-dependent dehydrogenase (short-subunit alcohol dehydrogenase family)